MKRKFSPFKLGLFTLVGVALILGAFFWVGAMRIFQKQDTYAAAFTSSVSGLDKGAPVKYLGVQIGQVNGIRIGPNDRYIIVTFSIEHGFHIDEQTVVEVGSGGIAGKPFVQIARIQGQAPKASVPFDLKYPLLASRQGGLGGLMDRASSVMDQVEQANIPALVQQWRQTAQALSQAVAAGDVRDTLANLHTASANLDQILGGLSGGGPAQWQGVFKDLKTTADALRQSTTRLSSQLEAMPPGALGTISKRMEKMVSTGEQALSSWDQRADQTLSTLDRSMQDVNRLVSEMERLVRSLRQSPGELLQQRPSQEPFTR